MLVTLLASALAALFLGAKASNRDAFESVVKDWKRNIRKYIKEPAEREAALRVLDEFRSLVDRLTQVLEAPVRELAIVNSRYSATLDDYRSRIEQIAGLTFDVQLEMAALDEKLRETLSPETYDNIETRIIEAARKRAAKAEKAEAKAEARAAKRATRARP